MWIKKRRSKETCSQNQYRALIDRSCRVILVKIATKIVAHSRKYARARNWSKARVARSSNERRNPSPLNIPLRRFFPREEGEKYFPSILLLSSFRFIRSRWRIDTRKSRGIGTQSSDDILCRILAHGEGWRENSTPSPLQSN